MPFKITSLPWVSMVMRLASTSAFRLNASRILRWMSAASTSGFTEMMLVTPLTPYVSRSIFGGGSLILPLHFAFEGQPAVLDDDLDAVVRKR